MSCYYAESNDIIQWYLLNDTVRNHGCFFLLVCWSMFVLGVVVLLRKRYDLVMYELVTFESYGKLSFVHILSLTWTNRFLIV